MGYALISYSSKNQPAADRGYALAQCDLGYCYFNGIGVKANRAAAVGWYRKAAAQGFEPAKKALSELGEKP